jgi:hypothetical protein
MRTGPWISGGRQRRWSGGSRPSRGSCTVVTNLLPSSRSPPARPCLLSFLLSLLTVSLERALSPCNLRRPFASSSKRVPDRRPDCRLCGNGSGAAWAASARGASFRPTVGRARAPQRSLFLTPPPPLPSQSSEVSCSILAIPSLPPIST